MVRLNNPRSILMLCVVVGNQDVGLLASIGKKMTEQAQEICSGLSAEYKVVLAAVLRELINQCSYNNFDIDGDHGINVVNVKDIMSIIEELENGN